MQVEFQYKEFDFESDEFMIWKTDVFELIQSIKNNEDKMDSYINDLFQSSLELNNAYKYYTKKSELEIK